MQFADILRRVHRSSKGQKVLYGLAPVLYVALGAAGYARPGAETTLPGIDGEAARTLAGGLMLVLGYYFPRLLDRWRNGTESVDELTSYARQLDKLQDESAGLVRQYRTLTKRVNELESGKVDKARAKK